jgi:glycosyltransferase involved in cell wall biosynthesis
MRKLVIISHTDHQHDREGRIVGWGPTVNEINHLANRFDAIEHVACLEEGPPKGGSLPYTDDRIRLRPIPVFGGKTLRSKLSVFTTAPKVIRAVREATRDATHVQLRLPMGIGLYLLPYFMFRRRGRYVLWVKYANNWGQRNPPAGYAAQRWMLRRNLIGCKVTLNGFWEGQPRHCHSFENPCLENPEIGMGRQVMERKQYGKPFDFAFVGRLEDPKGVSRILEALRRCDLEDIGRVHFIGDGKDVERYRSMAGFLGEKAVFHGFCNTAFVKETLESAHFFLLPTTASEGFPKALAEAACFGCIPVVSDVSSIPHYVKDGVNGFVWPAQSGIPFHDTLKKAMDTPPSYLSAIAVRGSELASKFTFERYAERLETEIFIN